MEYKDLIARLRAHYPELAFIRDDVECLIEAESNLAKLKACDDLTEREREKLTLLEEAQKYLS